MNIFRQDFNCLTCKDGWSLEEQGQGHQDHERDDKTFHPQSWCHFRFENAEWKVIDWFSDIEEASTNNQQFSPFPVLIMFYVASITINLTDP